MPQNTARSERNIFRIDILIRRKLAGVGAKNSLGDTNTATGNTDGKNGIVVILLNLITCGIFWWIWVYKAGEGLDAVKVKNGGQTGNRAILYLILSIFGLGIVAVALIQNELNELAVEGISTTEKKENTIDIE